MMLLIIRKGMRGRIYHGIHRYWEVNTKNMKNYDKNKESSYLKNQDVKDFYGWIMSQKLLLGSFYLVEKIAQFKEDFKNSYNDNIFSILK